MATNRRRMIYGPLAVLQSGAAIALAPVDAVLEAERFGWRVHVEAQERTHCPVGHGHIFGQVVRSLAAAGTVPADTGGPLLAPVLRARDLAGGPVAVRSQRSLFTGGVPRAPPAS